ncbi:hypothetical protein RHGRI_032434 [Rhododendron griersonianum]|nr:hypothetical protein RHGRI_032434 [Rhododendron griersonianum]
MSGHEKRKRKQKIDTLIQSQAGSLDKFFGSKKQKESLDVVEDLENAEEQEDMGNEENENLEDNTDAGAKEPNECVDDGDHEERLNGLSLLSIEHEMVDKIDCEDIISTFAAKTARRIIFK